MSFIRNTMTSSPQTTDECDHPERSCKWCFEDDCHLPKATPMLTITTKHIETTVKTLEAPSLSAEEKIILATLILKRNGQRDLDFQAGELLKRAYAHEEVRVNLNYAYDGC